MIDRGGVGHGIGERLLALSKHLFRHWHCVRDGTLNWPMFQARVRRLRREAREALEDGLTCGCAKTAATCFEILKVKEEALDLCTSGRSRQPSRPKGVDSSGSRCLGSVGHWGWIHPRSWPLGRGGVLPE